MRIRTLSQYLFKQNLFLLLTTLAAGSALYIMADLFDRLDDFLEAGLGLGTVATYFAAKLPLIISQIMPAVFLVSLVIQLCLMARSRELLALRSGGVSLAAMSRFFLAYALLWCLIQMAFSQLVGVYGQQIVRSIWSEQVRGNIVEKKVLYNIWFREGDLIVEAAQLRPAKNMAQDLSIYEMSDDRQSVKRIITAKNAFAETGKWTLHNVQVLDPVNFSVTNLPQMTLDLQQDPMTFVHIDPNVDPASLPMWQLSRVIERLDASGSNVERLRTAWHMNWSYAFSIMSMALLALALVTLSENVYLNIGLSLVLTFMYYVVYMVGATMGQKGMLLPWMGAWLGNIVFCSVAGGWLAWTMRPSGITRS
ncbi:LptF/LptG family permease [Desulfovibrio ferrophilus]|uniref:Permease YjgP/YjgQ family protein n=1 Tax=Desulfovibrio ferrophilus TaxID=241368 RepID=A0A2Z6AWS7_9BACT|nr:LptF/LptG family permease [Desulfovibrio ferrophilus]BBD07704.1 permease YjgP/YjgQ family protein [Desulfovibrio ferrophilus]